MMSKIYLPVSNINDFACYVVHDKDTIRAYDTTPALNTNSNYTDFYINSHYLSVRGSQSWNQWNSNIPICLDKNNFTNDIYYSNDLPNSLFIFLIFAIFIIILPFKFMGRIFGRWLRI